MANKSKCTHRQSPKDNLEKSGTLHARQITT